ncbi:hypothetical protein BsWGS_10221 [Bradybaena similaris]
MSSAESEQGAAAPSQDKTDDDVPKKGKGSAAKTKKHRRQDTDPETDSLTAYLAHSLALREKPKSKLEELTLNGIAKYLMSDQCNNIITMAGAGISTSAGIPDFRSPGTGLYQNLASYNLPHPQAIFELGYFKENPKPFFVLAKELYPHVLKPTPCHYFIKMLNDKGKLLRHYTQNIDTLERVSGLDFDKIVEAHGSFHSSHCLDCNHEYALEWMKEQIFDDKVPRCTEEGCSGVVKPDITFFGEALPRRFADLVTKDFAKCDLLIVMGTSLAVQPFASLVNRVPAHTPRLYINLEKGATINNPLAALIYGDGFNFDGENNYRDVFKGATCDEGCQALADLLDWGEDLKKIVEAEHARIDEMNASLEATKSSENTDSKKGKM